MQQEPRSAIHMEKQLGWACKLGGAEFLCISKTGATVLARLVESHIWHQLAGSIGRRFRKRIMASAHLDDRLFSFSLCATGAFQAAIPVLAAASLDTVWLHLGISKPNRSSSYLRLLYSSGMVSLGKTQMEADLGLHHPGNTRDCTPSGLLQTVSEHHHSASAQLILHRWWRLAVGGQWS